WMPRAEAVSRSAASSCSLTSFPPKPRKPPSFDALATRVDTSRSQRLYPSASAGALRPARAAALLRASSAWLRACSGDMPWISVGFVPSMPSRVVNSATMPSTSAFEPPFAFVSATSFPTANISFTTPSGPLGLAATTTRLAIRGLFLSAVHSSGVKSAFPAMWHLRARKQNRSPGRSQWGCGRSVLGRAVEMVVRLDETDGAGRRPHHDRVGHRPPAHVPHPGEVVARRDPRGSTHHHAGRELLQGVIPVEVEDAERAALPSFELISRDEAGLHLAAEAGER